MTKDVVIIAEAGVNHNAELETAKEMIIVAKQAGADYVKFQTEIPDLVVSFFAPKAGYQIANTSANESQLDMCRALALPFDDFRTLKTCCDENGISFLSSPFDLPSVDFLNMLEMDFWKIPSGEITNLPYLRRIAATKKPVVLSSGMSTLEEIEVAIEVLLRGGVPAIDDIIVLHCNTQYPTPIADVNLLAMVAMRDKLGVKVGYSDHTSGIEISIAAAALGANVIEKHFTLDRTLPGPDHKASLEPDELFTMVQAVRNVSLALGDGRKRVTKSERPNLSVARKSIVAMRAIAAGELLHEDNLAVKRPGDGISPMRWDDILGRRAHRDYAADELLDGSEMD
jgi:N,N'-diacetyllegionaminate synthase